MVLPRCPSDQYVSQSEGLKLNPSKNTSVKKKRPSSSNNNRLAEKIVRFNVLPKVKFNISNLVNGSRMYIVTSIKTHLYLVNSDINVGLNLFVGFDIDLWNSLSIAIWDYSPLPPMIKSIINFFKS